ncbi:hypothetical protein SFRURICE_011348 [Spodoptera frugiperda]|nr:hypothetical protein SFRURICE_011348 [Spodoptera frugiperda]
MQVTPAPDMLQVPGTGMTRGSSLTTKDQGGLIPPFEAIFKRSTLLQDVEGGLPDQLSPTSLPRSPSINKKVQLPRERVCDMSPEDQKAWEQMEMAKEIDFDRMLQIARKRDMHPDDPEYEDENLYICHIDPAPFQLVERTSLLKILVSLLYNDLTAQLTRWLGNWLPCNVSRVRFPYGTTLCVIHRLLFRIWVSCACEILRKAIEDVNSGALTLANRPEPPVAVPTAIKVVATMPAPPSDSETAKLTAPGDH